MERTDDWVQLELLCAWEEQREYERIRPLVLFGESVPERSGETGVSERTLYRKIAGFGEAELGSAAVLSSHSAVVEVDHAVAETPFAQQFELRTDIVGEGVFAAPHHDGRDE